MFNVSFCNNEAEFVATIAMTKSGCYGIGYNTYEEIKNKIKPQMLFALTFEDAKEKLKGICKENDIPELTLIMK